jgi:hypothetical protein
MRGSTIVIVGILLLLFMPAISIPGASQGESGPVWDSEYQGWSYRQEISLPIETNDAIAHYQPIDLRFRFEHPCWTENENKTSIRVACWYQKQWHNLESQIYSLTKNPGQSNCISECNVIFLIPDYADGTEEYFLYYDDAKTVNPSYQDHVTIEDLNYTSSPLPEISAVAKFYGITEDGYCVYGVGQDGQLLDRSCTQVVVKQKKECKEFDIINSDQIVSFAFSYYYGDKEKDESASDQVFLDKKIFIDGNLMVEFGIISESEKKDVQTTAIYRYYYCPVEDKRIMVHVKHEMLKDATVQGIDNIDGRFGSLISLKARSAVVESLNFGQIYPYLDFYGEKNKIEQYQLNQNPSTKDREWIISYQNDATLGSEAWLCYGDGKKGSANAVLFASNQGVVVSGTDEQDGIQLKVAEKEYINFLGTEVDYVSINFGRHSYIPGHSHDVTIPADLIVQFDAEVFASETGGYERVQEESAVYKALVKSRSSPGETPFERELKRYNVTIIPHFGKIHLTHPWLSNITGGAFPVMWIEITHEGRVVAEGTANRSLFIRGKITFTGVLEGEYLVKIFFKRGDKKIFTGSAILHLNKDTKMNVFCTWERTITFTFLDQNDKGIPGIHGRLTNKDGVLYDENTTLENGVLRVKAPFDSHDSYTLLADYNDLAIFDGKLEKTIKKLNKEVTVGLYDFTVVITDELNMPPGIDVTPVLLTSNSTKTVQITPQSTEKGSFIFEGIPAGDYNLQINYGEFLDDVHVTIPESGPIIQMKFSALFHLVLELYDYKGNPLVNDNIEFVVLRDNQTITRTMQKTLTLPPASYTINAYLDNHLIGVKPVSLTNDKHVHFVTIVESVFPLLLSLFFYGLFGFFVILTILKKFSVSSLLKSLAILLVILSFFQPWWMFIGQSTTLPAGKTTALYVNPGMMIETKTYYGEVSLSLAEIPDIFLLFLVWIVPIASLVCVCITLGIILRRTQKKNYGLFLSIIGVVLLGILLAVFTYGATRLIETSLGTVQGEEMLSISMGAEDILMNSTWGFSTGFYLIGLAVIIAVLGILLEIRVQRRQKKRLK